MKKEIDFQIPENMGEKEFDDLLKIMDVYSVDFPGEVEMDSTIDALRQYVPSKRRSGLAYLKRAGMLLQRAASEMAFISRAYWIISLVLFITGWRIAAFFSQDSYMTAMLLAPIPLIPGIVEVFRGREEGMLEIELACKISASEVMFSRLTLIGIYNVLINTVLMSILDVSSGGLDLWRMLLSWMAPFTLTAGLSLWMAMKIRSGYTAAVLSSVWVVFIYMMASDSGLRELVMSLDILAYLTIIFIGVVLIIIQIRKIVHRYSMFEGSAFVEANN